MDLSTVALVATALSPVTLAFAPSRPAYNYNPTRIKSTTTLSETKEGSTTSAAAVATNGGGSGRGRGWSIGAPSRQMKEAERKKQVAKDALNKLLERQQRDVRQTLDLLDNLEYDYEQFEELGELEHAGDAFFEETFDNVTSSLEDAAPSITKSVAAGADYGYISRSEGCRVESIDYDDRRFEGYGPPGNVFSLGSQQFMRNLRAMIGEYKDEESDVALTERQRELQAKLKDLTLDSEAIWDRERARGEVVAPWIIKIPYFVLCYLLDVVFEGRNSFSRFFLLETVARMPYFAYITMLHLYETLGFWRRSADIKRIHFAEEWNEFHHLLIMESLGGDQPYWVRFMAQHSALAYYLALCILWMISPTLSYKFSEMLETHAVDTYGQFVDENAEKLKELPPSLVAVEYYTVGVSDPMFGEYQTASVTDPHRGVRKPGTDMRSLYDVFVAIRNDEGDHVQTMASCLDPKAATLSPALESRVLTGMALAAGTSLLLGSAGLGSIGAGLAGMDGIEGLSDVAEGMTDLDSILSEEGASGLLNAIVGGLAGLSSGLQEIIGVEGAEIDDDVAGSAVEDFAAGGLDGFELETFFELVKSILVGIVELIGLGL
eukprot:CAMPEP_0181137874 /NCGR_PEP_ID=MMETSP1071-20121207/33932_1 /TAXON_ID=35127 /ORGANISM="Thalassiosira sp., Strain NH16" /LENGTH=604 /DNA_ID=CAMNT_0023224645 /DNA_START=181 /DNA_END=1995 /DNA_ORIENTATION=+